MSEPAARRRLESVWLVEATYAPDAAETRGPFRAEHLAGVRERLASGVYVEAGAFADVSASVILVRADSAEAAIDAGSRRRVPAQWRLGRGAGPGVRTGDSAVGECCGGSCHRVPRGLRSLRR